MRRYSPILRENFGEGRAEARMREAADGGYVHVDDIPEIEAQAKQGERERLRVAVGGPLQALLKGPTRTDSREADMLVEQARELAEEALAALDFDSEERES